jgi:hypothetical protein
MVEKPEVDVDDVVDVNEVAPVLAVGSTMRPGEQTNMPGTFEEEMELQDDARHARFVQFAGAVNVEVAKTYDLARCAGEERLHISVENPLEVRILVQRPRTAGRRVVDGRRRRIDELDPVTNARPGEPAGESCVVLSEEHAIAHRGIRAGALVQDRANRSGETSI